MRRLALIISTLLLIGAAAIALLVTRGHGHEPTAPPATTRAHPGHRPHAARFSWPLYGFDAARTHAAPVRLRPPFRKLWTVHGDWSLIEFPPVLEGGRLFAGTNHGLVLAVQARTGRVMWHRQFAGCVAASPAVGNGVVYLGFMDPPPCRGTDPTFFVALDARTGHTIWRFRTGVVETSPLLVDGRVYFGSWDRRVYALAARTGRLDWSFATGDRVKGGVAYARRTVFAGSYDGHLYALDARNGRLRWAAGGGALGGLYATPSVANGRVLVGSTNGRVYAFATATGKLLWSISTGSYVYSPAALAGATAYIGSTRSGRPQAGSVGRSTPARRSRERRRCWAGSSTSRPAGRARATSPIRGRGGHSPSTRARVASSGGSRTASTAR
jgi:outer membrane protein assembly factor BamB